MAKINNPSLLLFRSSAGSGKTRTLAKEYIKLVLVHQPEYFRHILAVTFANKATQEMKERILQYLDDFANRRRNNLTDEIKQDLVLDEDKLQVKSQEVLSSILHSYSQFAISTIDSFFQRVIRAFTREAGLLGNFRLEVDNDYVLDEVIASLMNELGHNPELTDWVVQFSRDRLLEGENWNIVYALKGFAQEIFKEQFKVIEESIFEADRGPDENKKVRDTLRAEVRQFLDFMRGKGTEAMGILGRNGITKNDFNYGDSGTPFKYFAEFGAGRYYSSDGARILGALASSSDWASKKSLNNRKLKELAEFELMPILQQMVKYDNENNVVYNSAFEVLKNYYSFGLITDISRKLKTYRDENNVMLLSDASKFLNGVINKSDTPFIYEKVGSWFRNYLVDEFQDTSSFQWKNLIPLLREASDQSNMNLIVGDVKQSIYRWRGGDLELLQNGVVKEFGSNRVETVSLDTNYRSAGKIVSFNNTLFRSASAILSSIVENDLPQNVFSDAEQKISKWPDKGFVRISFLERGGEEGWEEQSIRLLPGWLETLQSKGADLKDIAIIVRKNEEGQRIADYLLRFQQSPDAKPGYQYDVVSNESLRLDTSFSVNVLVAALKFLKNPDDRIARGQLAYEVATSPQLDELFIKAAQGTELRELLTEEFVSQIRHLKKLSLFELIEELIRIFHLGSQNEELAYLHAFQDQVLEFSSREKTDIASFLDWWEMYKEKKSIKVSASVNAVNILTIHGSKGLQYKYVIVPFCSWKLNHEFPELMWVDSDQPPFSDLGPVAVRYNDVLDKTIFKKDYQREMVKAHLDNLNLLYVAFTRAEVGLIGFAPIRKGEQKKPSNVGDLICKVLLEQEPLSAHFNGVDFQWGEVEAINGERESVPVQSVRLNTYASSDWREKLVIKREGFEFFEDVVSDKRSKINRGILLHTILSKIEFKADAKEKLENFFLEYALPPEEMEAIKDDVQRILEHPQMTHWFSKEWKIKAEALVLLPGGRQKRIDRIMIGKSRTVIVDYKTGEKKAIDKDQVEAYALILAQMGYPNVQAFLVYLKDLKVEEVISKSTLSLF